MTKIYLISPPKINLETFSSRLNNALQTGLVEVFQLRLKDYPDTQVENIARAIKEICHANNCLFILNDYVDIALKIGADGVHLGSDDRQIQAVKKQSPENFIIGASCYDSKHLAMQAGESGATYLSFGAFFTSKTKQSRGKPDLDILEWCNELISLPIVAIGGITNENCHDLVKAGADFLSVISYVWDHPEGEVKALQDLHQCFVSDHNILITKTAL